MSSFKPQALHFDTTFRATRIGSAGGFRSTRESGAGDTIGEQVGPNESSGRLLSDSEIADLEAAAFERGAESARPERERFEHACDALASSAHELQARKESIRLASPAEIVDLALEIARCWVGERFEADPTCYVATLERALEVCRERAPERLFLNAEDRSALEALDPARLGDWKQSLGLEVVEGAGLSRGEFRIEARTGLVEGRFEAVMAGLREELAGSSRVESPKKGDEGEAG